MIANDILPPLLLHPESKKAQSSHIALQATTPPLFSAYIVNPMQFAQSTLGARRGLQSRRTLRVRCPGTRSESRDPECQSSSVDASTCSPGTMNRHRETPDSESPATMAESVSHSSTMLKIQLPYCTTVSFHRGTKRFPRSLVEDHSPASQCASQCLNALFSLRLDDVILHAARNEAGSNSWKLWVMRVASFSRCLVGMWSRQPSMAWQNSSKVL